MKSSTLLISLFLFSLSNAQVLKTSSEVKEVTIYINGATVNRSGQTEIISGKSEIILTGLSPYLDPKTIQFNPRAEVIILSISHKLNYIDTNQMNTKHTVLKNQLEATDQQIRQIKVNQEIIEEQLDFLKSNKIFGSTASDGKLNTLKEMSTYFNEQVKSMKTKNFELDQDLDKLSKIKMNIEKQLKEQINSQNHPWSEIMVTVSSKTNQKLNFELSYLVKNVSWLPSYTIQVDKINQPVDIIYKATILQNSLEDWKDVKIILSSANPQTGNIPPSLMTYFLDYYTSPPRYGFENKIISGLVFDEQTKDPLIGATVLFKGTTIGTITDANGMFSLPVLNSTDLIEINYVGYDSKILPITGTSLSVGLKPGVLLEEVVVTGYSNQDNTIGNELQGRVSGVEVTRKNQSSNDKIPIPVIQSANQITFTFEVQTAYTLLSGNKPISLEIQTISIPANLKYLSIPKIDKDAFLIAHIIDWEKYNLLDGEANIILENNFVGKTILQPQQTEDTLNISLGRDYSILINRQLMKDHSTKQFIGNKKTESITWKITIVNNKSEKIQVELMDQIPVSKLGEIEVDDEQLTGGQLDSKTGEVVWNLIVEPGSKKEIILQYQVKYPKEKILHVE